MEYQIEENSLTILLPAELDHCNAEQVRKRADMLSITILNMLFLTLRTRILWIVRELESLWEDISWSI